MTQEPLQLTREVAETCYWCGLAPSVTKVYATPTCQGCVDGGSQHRVRVSLARWGRGVERRQR